MPLGVQAPGAKCHAGYPGRHGDPGEQGRPRPDGNRRSGPRCRGRAPVAVQHALHGIAPLLVVEQTAAEECRGHAGSSASAIEVLTSQFPMAEFGMSDGSVAATPGILGSEHDANGKSREGFLVPSEPARAAALVVICPQRLRFQAQGNGSSLPAPGPSCSSAASFGRRRSVPRRYAARAAAVRPRACRGHPASPGAPAPARNLAQAALQHRRAWRWLRLARRGRHRQEPGVGGRFAPRMARSRRSIRTCEAKAGTGGNCIQSKIRWRRSQNWRQRNSTVRA